MAKIRKSGNPKFVIIRNFPASRTDFVSVRRTDKTISQYVGREGYKVFHVGAEVKAEDV